MLTDDEGVKKLNILTKTEKRQPKKGDCVTCEYVGSLKSSGKEFDSGTLTLTLGNDDVIKGFEIAVLSMSLEEKSTFYIRFDYGYGERGLHPKIPPHADLVFQIELLRFEEEKKNATTLAIEDKDTIEARKRMASHKEKEKKRTVVSVNGEPVQIDGLGPIVLNSNGTFSRITNWHTMTKEEQAKTIRLIGKRNKIRRRKLLSRQ